MEIVEIYGKRYFFDKKACNRWIVIFTIVNIILFIIAFGGVAKADDNWEFNFFGITKKDFQHRSIIKVVIGMGSSFLVHEAGHILMAETLGDGWNWERNAVICEGYNDMSHTQRQLFHAGGFIAQGVVGGILTAIPATRHSDFTLGFNSFASVNSLGYTITKRNVEKYPTSDIARLDNGEAIGLTSFAIHGVFSYINLNKYK